MMSSRQQSERAYNPLKLREMWNPISLSIMFINKDTVIYMYTHDNRSSKSPEYGSSSESEFSPSDAAASASDAIAAGAAVIFSSSLSKSSSCSAAIRLFFCACSNLRTFIIDLCNSALSSLLSRPRPELSRERLWLLAWEAVLSGIVSSAGNGVESNMGSGKACPGTGASNKKVDSEAF